LFAPPFKDLVLKLDRGIPIPQVLQGPPPFEGHRTERGRDPVLKQELRKIPHLPLQFGGQLLDELLQGLYHGDTSASLSIVGRILRKEVCEILDDEELTVVLESGMPLAFFQVGCGSP
jgi:hypothetical protein